MKIERVETMQADAGWRMFSFLKLVTDDGIIGWSEFNESFGSVGLSDVSVACRQFSSAEIHANSSR
jgi:galactonate dehydratase